VYRFNLTVYNCGRALTRFGDPGGNSVVANFGAQRGAHIVVVSREKLYGGKAELREGTMKAFSILNICTCIFFFFFPEILLISAFSSTAFFPFSYIGCNLIRL